MVPLPVPAGLSEGAIVKGWPSSFRVNNVGSFRIDGVTVEYRGSELEVVYALDPFTKQLTPILKTGDSLEFAPAQSKQILSVSTTNEISDNNTFAARVTFDDGTLAEYLVKLTSAPSPPLGDYNLDGIVYAADYTVWRDTLGQSGAGLSADGYADGQIDAADYDVWKLHFGQTSGGGGAAARSVGVPEPSSIVLILLGTVMAWPGIRRCPVTLRAAMQCARR
jgi:hypothetical protein